MDANAMQAAQNQPHKFQRWTVGGGYHEPPRYEILDGKIVMMASASEAHIWIAGNVMQAFRNYLRGKRCRPYAELDVHLNEKNVVKPDVMIVCRPETIRKNHVYGAPDLVVEILSPRTANYDLGYKKNLYESAGVKEYWLVNPTDKSVTVYHLVDGAYKLAGVYYDIPADELAEMDDEDRAEILSDIKVSLYDDLTITAQDVFADMMTSYAK